MIRVVKSALPTSAHDILFYSNLIRNKTDKISEILAYREPTVGFAKLRRLLANGQPTFLMIRI